MRQLLIMLACLPVFSFAQFSSQDINRYKTQANRVTIMRDQWGVPHIYGKTDADAVFGLLYAQCEENFNQVEENYLEMLGRLSEIYGEGQLYNDLQMQLIYDTSAAIADYKKAPIWLKKLLDASADGINFYLFKHPEVKPKILNRFEPWFALLRTDGSIGATQTGGLTTTDMKTMYPVNSATSFLEKQLPFFETNPTGSNGFAVAPSRTASKNAILYINPHTSFYYRTEVQLASDEGLNAYGAVTWGTFFIYQGFNENCGWMHTSSYADVADLFAEKTVDHEGKIFYEYDGRLQPVKSKQLYIGYRKNDTILRHSFTTYSTLHGPVVGKREGKWLALKENNRSMEALSQSWLRMKAKGFEDFKRIMNMRVNNSNNTVFADNKGNIAYWHGNFMPKRDSKYDYSSLVDGSISATNWKGVHALNEIVHIYNPSSGWIQNCNSTPFSAAGNSSPKKEDYPEYMAPDGENFRAVNAAKLLALHKNLTIQSMIDSIGYNRYLSAFDYLMQALNSAYGQLETGDTLRLKVKEAVDLLNAWDKYASAESIATTIAIEWGYRVMQKSLPVSNPYRSTHALAQLFITIGSLDAKQLIGLLAETQNDLEKRFGRWKITWGEVNRYQRTLKGRFDDQEPSLPVGLGPGTFGSLPSYSSRRFQNTDKRYGVSGNSFIACVEFGKKLKAKSVITGGQSFDPQSKHFNDQAEMYVEGRFKDVLFYKEDVLKNAVRKYHPGE